MKLSKSGASHFKQGTTKWYISMKLHYFEGCPGAFFIPAIKSLPTYFLFITAPSIPSPNVWVSTHLNTWKPSCLLRQRKPASCRIWNVCSQDRGEFRPAWLPVAKELGTSQGGMCLLPMPNPGPALDQQHRKHSASLGLTILCDLDLF